MEYIEAGTNRTVDKQQQNITTSEGQSYTMLRAVWIDDKPTFDKSWNWTQANLKQPNSALFSWLYGLKPDGSYGVLSERGGVNSASDADIDIALALYLASIRWNQPRYREIALTIIEDIWRQEVIIINGKPVLASNNVEKDNPDQIIVNPSYFAPYAFRKFAQLDTSRAWLDLVQSSYDILERSTAANLDRSSTANLPPDWITVDRQTGEIKPITSGNLTTNFSYDAFRIPWRIAVDWQWNQEPRARTYLTKLQFLNTQWQSTQRLAAIYSHDGLIIGDYEQVAMYGGSLGYFETLERSVASTIIEKKIISNYSPDQNAWKQSLGYYDDNWAWFGLALHEGFISDFEK